MKSSTNAAKRWLYIMPIVFITYSLAYLDRANFSFASAAGINDDLGITKGVSSLLGALFFLGSEMFYRQHLALTDAKGSENCVTVYTAFFENGTDSENAFF